jgi:hypothetical protein
MLNTFKIDLLRELKEQIWTLIVSNEHTSGETRAYMDVIGMIDKKIKDIRYTRQPIRG